MIEFISNGIHYLSGVCMVSFFDEYVQEDIDGVMFTIDDVNYIAATDPNDGYRSYGMFLKTDMEQKNKFPKQEVVVTITDIDSIDENGWEINKKFLTITNTNGDVILKIGTDYSDTYYPCAIFHYYPQNMPINKGKE